MIKSVSIFESSSPKPGSLSVCFDLDDSQRLPYEFQLWIAELTGVQPTPGEKKFYFPSSQFLSRIEDFQALRRRFGNFPIEYGDYFESLISRYSQDKERLKLAKEDSQSRIDESQVREGLKQAGFMRWNTQSSDQLRDIGRLAFLPNGANFSVPGAGKTNTLLAVHALSKNEIPNLKLLIVCPKNAMLAWDEEVEACIGSSSKVVRLQGSNAQLANLLSESPDFSVISYQKLKGASKEILSFLRSNEVHVVLDESHRIKAGNNSQQGSSALALADYAVRRDILSGTPMPQGFADLVPQFKFLWPHLDLFRNIRLDQDPEIQIKQANEDIRPFFVRTTKHELGLPKPHISYIPVEMSPLQSETYALIKNESARYIAGLNPEDKEELRKIGRQIMRVLQFCSEPNLLLEKLPHSFRGGELFSKLEELSLETSNKTILLDQIVRKKMSQPGEKIVIWSMFVDQIERLVTRYSEYGAISIHGGVPTGPDDDIAFREARIKLFKTDPNCRVLVANPAACGEGISLHKEAHHAVYFDRSFNAAHFLQSIDRIHRRGLPAGTETYIDILFLDETIEEAVRDRLSIKIKLLQQLLDDEDLSAMVFDPEDVELFGEDDIVSASDVSAVINSLNS